MRLLRNLLLASTLGATSAMAGEGWETDYQLALEAAQKGQKMVLANFTGSDWCGWCIKLHKEVFDQKAFRTWARENVVLLELDFPRRKPQSAELKKQNAELQNRFRIEGYPTVVLLNAEGKEVGRTGYVKGGPEAWIASADKILDAARMKSLWGENFEDALRLSRKTGRPILADFTGSDWCSWCIKLDKEVFTTTEFQTWARENVVLVKLDYPRRKPQEKWLKEQNDRLLKKYRVQKFPTVLVLGHDGRRLGELGYQPGGPKAWIIAAERKLGGAPKSSY